MSDTEGGLSELFFEGCNLFTNLALLLFEFLALDFGFDGADDLEFLVASLLVGYVEASDFVVERIVDGEIFGLDGSITKGSKQDVGSLLIAVELADLVLVFGNGCTQLLLQFLDLVLELGTDDDVTGVVVHGEAAGKKDDAHILTKVVIVHGTPDNFDVAVEAIDKMVHLCNFGHGDGVLVAETKFEEQVLGIGDLVVLKQRRSLGCLDGLAEAVFAVGATGGDECHATVAEGGGDIGKVEVDVSALVDDVGDGLGGSGERIVGLAEGVAEVEVGVNVDEAIVVDHEKGIAPLFDGLYTFERHEDLLLAFELERDCDNADGEDAEFVGDLCHDGRSTGTCSATHTCGNEDHLGAIGQSLADGFGILLGEVASDFRLGTCTESFFADEELVGDVGAFECLLVCINNEE